MREKTPLKSYAQWGICNMSQAQMNSQENNDIDMALLKIVVVGHVDDGKSTLIGRLLHETGSLAEGKYEEIKEISLKRHMPMEWSFVLDAFQVERDQAITIDTTQIILNTPTRKVVVIDAPGHIEFLKNMISGAADADAAILLIDGSRGIQQQTRRHAYLLNLLGIQQVVVLINKMDLIEFSSSVFEKLSSEISNYFKEIHLKPQAIIPISARYGDMLITSSENMAWYKGPTVLEAINSFAYYNLIEGCPLRFPVQDIYKFDERRIIVGRIESGVIRIGDELRFSPSNQTAKVHSIEHWHDQQKLEATAGESIGITLDTPVFIERGEIISHFENPPILSNQFYATLFWLGNQPLKQGSHYKLKIATRESRITVQTLEYEINTDTLERKTTTTLNKNQCGKVLLRTRELLPLDEYHHLRQTGRFVLVDNHEIIAGGMISMKELPNQRDILNNTLNLTTVQHHITTKQREEQFGHKGGVLWFTGLSGSGKSTLAMKLEHLLFSKGYQVYVLDGDNIRSRMNSTLGFSPKDRKENIRRTGEIATLFADAGFICITALISPYEAERNNIRQMMLPGTFHEVYIKADLQSCILRDPKGLYKKAQAGEISEFTGISAPYETPINADLIIDTVDLKIEECISKITEYIKENFSLTRNKYKDSNFLSEFQHTSELTE
jgi:bifunctional enzyme CysN/CysC